MPLPMTISDDAWADARSLHIAHLLEEYVQKSVPTLEEFGHRRYDEYFFVIEGRVVIGVNTENAVNCTKEERAYEGPDLEMTCPACLGEASACETCGGAGKVTRSAEELIDMLEAIIP
jgi:methionyl-tRNA synthetase